MPSFLVPNEVKGAIHLLAVYKFATREYGGAGLVALLILPPVLHTSHHCLDLRKSKPAYVIYLTFVVEAAMQNPPSTHMSSPLGNEAQPSRISWASINTGNTASLHPTHSISNLAQLALAIRSLNGNSILVLIPVRRVANGEQTWSCIGDFLRRVSTTNHRGTWIEAFLARDVVGTAYIHQVSPIFKIALLPTSGSLPPTCPCAALTMVNHQITPCDSILSVPCFRVSLRGYKHDTLFTQALERPALLSRQADYLSHHEGFTVVPAATRNLCDQSVIVIHRELDKLKVVCLLSPLLVVSPGLGLLIGMRSHSAEVGLAVSAMIFALVSCFQGVVAWLSN